MKYKRSTLISTTVSFLLLIVILILTFNLLNKDTGVSVMPIKKGIDQYRPDNSRYRYYTQPVANRVVQKKAPWIETPSIATINKDTLNERLDYSIEKPKNTFRIITLGDSWTFGVFVDTENNFSEKLEGFLNSYVQCTDYSGFEVINLGVPGNDIQYSVERYRLVGQKYNPDLLVWLLILNDFDTIVELLTPKIRTKIPRGTDVNIATTDKTILQTHRELRKEWLEAFTFEDLLTFQKEALKEINMFYKGPLLLFTPPPQVASIPPDFLPIVEEFIEERPFSDFYISNIKNFKEEMVFPDYHPNIEGHSALAIELKDFILQKYLKNCKIKKTS